MSDPTCAGGRGCQDGRHGWDCELSDPLEDCRAHLGQSLANPILERTRSALVERWFPRKDAAEGSGDRGE